ncbi:hypothetical protein H4R35_006380 [Dimargaris xerosporica]|nr:hypothetical protein H4R35_006380 [Dimargaris xerosporica]
MQRLRRSVDFVHQQQLDPKRLWGKTLTSEFEPDPAELIDYVVVFQYDGLKAPLAQSPKPTSHHRNAAGSHANSQATAIAAYQDVLARLDRAGFDWFVSDGASRPGQLFIFVKCQDPVIHDWHTRSCVQDWLAGVRTGTNVSMASSDSSNAPTAHDTTAAEDGSHPVGMPAPTAVSSIPPAERLRLVHTVLTASQQAGGADLHPVNHPHIATIFPLHNKRFTRGWVKSWSLKWLIDQRDLCLIKDYLGEKIAIYFAFLQFYFLGLLVPAAVGIGYYALGGHYSASFAVFILAWSIAFTEAWDRRQHDIATYWGTRNLATVEEMHPYFRPQGYTQDSVTGEMVAYYPVWRRWLRRCVTVPLMGVGVLGLAVVIGVLFALQTFADEHYAGPLQGYATFVPVVLYSLLVSKATQFYLALAHRLNRYENYKTCREYEAHLTQKIFVLSFLINYLALFLSAWLYIPFRHTINQMLTSETYPSVCGWWINQSLNPSTLFAVFHQADLVGLDGSLRDHKALPIKSSETPADQLLLAQLFYFVITGQVINFAQETVVPALTRYASQWWAEKSGRQAPAHVTDANNGKAGAATRQRSDSTYSTSSTSTVEPNDQPTAPAYDHLDADDEASTLGETPGVVQEGRVGPSATAAAPQRTHPPGMLPSPPSPSVQPRLGLTADEWSRRMQKLRHRLVRRALAEYELPEYDIFEDYSEMVTQFGFVALFSVVWPLSPLAAVLNNWVELRSDAVKLCINVRRPVPQRVESIGPWLLNLKMLCWMASITNALLVYQFGSWTVKTEVTRYYGHAHFPTALVVLFLAEHLYFLMQRMIRAGLSAFPSAAQSWQAANEYQLKCAMLKELAPGPLHHAPSALSSTPGTAKRALELELDNASHGSAARNMHQPQRPNDFTSLIDPVNYTGLLSPEVDAEVLPAVRAKYYEPKIAQDQGLALIAAVFNAPT